MATINETIGWIEVLFVFLSFTLPGMFAVYSWFWKERRKQFWVEYQYKAKIYQELIDNLEGFKIEFFGDGVAKRKKFLALVNLSWMYCSDNVIRCIYAFLAMEKIPRKSGFTREVRNAAMGNLVSAIRKDMLARKISLKTNLTGKDFQVLSVMG